MKHTGIKEINVMCIVVLLFLISRIFFIFTLNISPDQNFLEDSWQFANLYFLKNHFYETIKFLNFQPPLWNFYIGFLLKVFKTEAGAILIAHLLNIVSTIVILLLLVKTANLYQLKKNQIIFVALLVIVNPAIFFYETFAGYYVHCATFSLVLFFYLLKKYFENPKKNYEIYIYLLLTSLIYIWSAFSFFVLLIFFTINIIFKIKKNITIKSSIYIFVVFLLVSLLPSIKNYNQIKYFSNGSHGMGWHLAMTTSSIKNDFTLHHECGPWSSTEIDNNKYIEKYNVADKNLSITNLPNKNFNNRNQLGRIFKSQKCEKKAIKYIGENLGLWIRSRLVEFFISHGQLAIDISFITKPHLKNFDKYEKYLKKIHKNNQSKIIKQFLLISYFFIIYVYFFRFIFFTNKRNVDNFAYITIFILYFYLLSIGTIFSNYEGSKFIQVGIIVQILFWISIIKDYNNYKLDNKQKAV